MHRKLIRLALPPFYNKQECNLHNLSRWDSIVLPKKKKKKNQQRMWSNYKPGRRDQSNVICIFFLLVCLFLSHTSVKVADKKPQSSQMKLLEK